MTSLQPIVISNVLLATALALVVIGLTRVWRNRHVAHLLWVIVLAKLVTPPLWNVSAPIESIFGTRPSNVVTRDDLTSGLPVTHSTREAADASVLGAEVAPAQTKPSTRHSTTGAAIDWSVVLMLAWCVSSVLWLLVVLTKTISFHALVRQAEPAGARQRERVTTLSRELGLRHSPDTRLINAAISPMVWPLARRRMLLLPKKLVGELTPTQLDTVIAHELAHLARRDDLVRLLETAVTCLFWWNPLVWLARRELRAAEEDCCDALVVCTMPESRQEYGEALLRAAELITFGRALPALASAFGQQRFLKRRIEMVLKHEFHRSASWQAKLMLSMLSLGVLPLSATAMSQEEQPRQRSVETDVANKWQRSGAQLREAAPETHFDKVLREADRKMKQLAEHLHDAARQSQQLEAQNGPEEAEKRAGSQPRTFWWWKPERRPVQTMSPASVGSIWIDVDGVLRAARKNQQLEEQNSLEKTLRPTEEGRKRLNKFFEKCLRDAASPVDSAVNPSVNDSASPTR
ncbi:MAG: M56 family metallopeptidase [Planctomycetes bacterium]|nr:M56 family metallopeptidase [Planctomycetota bacterium]MBL7043339.1 M56 family metallopeptidase [Pirellulaceae bacterium]